MMLVKRGKPLKLVLAASTSKTAVENWTTRKYGPSPTRVRASWPTTVWASDGSGMIPNWPERKLMPTKMVANRPPIQINTVWAFDTEGALNAGTPLDTASVPVNATEPEANARRISRVMNATTTTMMGTRYSTTSGNAEVMAATPAAVETDTVRM